MKQIADNEKKLDDSQVQVRSSSPPSRGSWMTRRHS